MGTGRQDMEVAGAGDIVSLTGAGAAAIADTIAGLGREEALAPGHIEPPTLRHAAAAANIVQDDAAGDMSEAQCAEPRRRHSLESVQP